MMWVYRHDSRHVLLPSILVCSSLVIVGLLVDRAKAQDLETGQAVAIVANIGGEANIYSNNARHTDKKAALQSRITYGDRIQTAQNAMVSMLVGQDTVISLDELSEVAIGPTPGSSELFQVNRGTSCICTKSQVNSQEEMISIQTPSTTIQVKPGSMFRLSVANQQSQTGAHSTQPEKILTTFRDPGPSVFRTQSGNATGNSVSVESIEVMHGSVNVLSQVPGAFPVKVEKGFKVDVNNGLMGQPERTPITTCQNENLQRNPQHTSNPSEIRTFIAETQSTQATGLVAALITPQVPTPTASTQPSEPNVVLPTTLEGTLDQDDAGTPGGNGGGTPPTPPGPIPPVPPGPPGPAPRIPTDLTTPSAPGAAITNSTVTVSGTDEVIGVSGPNPVEPNASTLTLNNSAIAGTATSNVTLVSLSSGGTLRGISNDPVVSMEDSQIVTESVVNVVDSSLLEASAPLIAAISTVNTGAPQSLISTSGDTIAINGSQMIASLPADALAVIDLNASNLITSGAVFSVTNGGTFAVNGNLVSLLENSTLLAETLVALSGGSNFGLTGGSLLVGDSTSSATLNNTLCAGGGCIGGIVFAPPGNTVLIDPSFEPTQGVNVSTDAALVVLGGTGNTVVLNP